MMEYPERKNLMIFNLDGSSKPAMTEDSACMFSKVSDRSSMKLREGFGFLIP
jgi:hypothetical protein